MKTSIKRGTFGENAKQPFVCSTKQVVHIDNYVEGTTLDEVIQEIKDEKISIDDLDGKVEGTVVEDGGEPSVDVGVVDEKINFALKNLKGEKGEDGNDGAPGPTGPQGPQGDSVIVGEGDLPLTHTTGLSNQKAMSQIGVNDAIHDGLESNGTTSTTQNVNYYTQDSSNAWKVDASTGQFTAGNAWRSIQIDLEDDMKSIVIAASSAGRGYAFVDDEGTRISGGDANSATVTLDAVAAIRAGATKFRYCKNTTSGTQLPITIVKETFSWPTKYESLGYNTNGWMTQRAVKQAVNIDIKTFTSAQIKAWNSGSPQWFINDSGNWASTSSSNYAQYNGGFTSYRGKTITIVANSDYAAQIAFLKSLPSSAGGSASGNYCEGTARIAVAKSQTYMATVPDDCVYLYVRAKGSDHDLVPTSISISEPTSEYVKELETNLPAQIDQQIANATDVVVAEWTSAQIKNETFCWYINDSDKWASTGGNDYARRIDFAKYKGKKISIKANSSYKAHIAFLKGWPSSTGGTVAEYCDDTTKIVINAGQSYSGTVPDDCVYLYVRHLYGGNDYVPSEVIVSSDVSGYAEEIGKMVDAPSTVYVSSSGNDDNSGTAAQPKKTIAAALNAGTADMTVVLLSDITGAINLTSWNDKKNHVTIRGDKNQNRKIIVGKKLAGEGWQAYEGYDDVYTYTKGDGESLPTDSIESQYRTYYWLWQYDIADTNSLISASERHPLQRGRQYRMRNTKVGYVSTLSALLEATSPCWTIDDGTLYVRVVADSDTSDNPIFMPLDYGNAIVTGNFHVTLSNIETWFGRIYVGGWAQSSAGNGDYLFDAYDCAVRCCTGSGGWQIDDGVSVHLERCEAEGVTMIGSTGDGFNLHPQSGDTRPFAKDSTHTLIDCWAHDNRDDGYSDHGRSEGTIIGGLFEHNGKGGLAPSTGSHDTIYMATSQNNNSGILAGGITEGAGIGTQVSCHGCVCINNLYNYNCVGYTSAQQVKLELNNCISRRAKTGGAAIYAHDPCEVVVRDCTDYGSPTVKLTASSGVITIDNGTTIA